MSCIPKIKERKENALKDVKTKPGAALKTVLESLPVREKDVGKKPEKKIDKKDDEKTKQAKEEAYKKEKAAFEKSVTEARDIAAECVLTVLCSIESAKIAGAVKELDDDERDTLMKYVYRGFSERTDVEEKGTIKKKAKYDCNLLLKVHEEIIKVAGGNGPIIRTIHSRLEA